MIVNSSLLITLFCIALLTNSYAQESFALTNVTIIDVEESGQLDNMSILVKNGVIQSIQKSGSLNLEQVKNVVDLRGQYLIPGLIDAHVHLFRPKNRKEILTKLLYSGVTSVRDMGGDARVYQSLNEEIEAGKLIGPDIYFSANVFGPTFLRDARTKFAAKGYKPGTAPWMRVINDDTDLLQVVVDAKEAGVTGLKVYSNVRPELLKKLSKVAHENGLMMWSHSSIYPSKPSDAVNAEVDVLSHALGLIFEVQANMPESFGDAIKNHVVNQDFKNTNELSPAYISLFEKMKSKGIILEPTISVSNAAPGPQKPKPPNKNEENPTAHLQEARKKLDPVAISDWKKRITKAAYDNGVIIAAGTDLSANMKWVQDEIIDLAECGLTNIDALKAATLNNAKAIGIEDSEGSIAVGKIANLVVLSENPLEKIENIRTVISVYKKGTEYKKTE